MAEAKVTPRLDTLDDRRSLDVLSSIVFRIGRKMVSRQALSRVSGGQMPRQKMPVDGQCENKSA